METNDPEPQGNYYSLVPSAESTATHRARPEMEARAVRTLSRRNLLLMLASFGLGAGAGYFYRDRGVDAPAASPQTAQPPPVEQASPVEDEPTATPPVALPSSYTASAQFGEIGPQLLEAGAIDYGVLAAAHERSGQPLTAVQRDILREGSDAPVLFDQESSYFLLNLFWALGLTNRNAILLQGPLFQYTGGEIGRYASTGGWTAGTKPVTDLYASTSIVELSAEQQARVEEVAAAVYRPCCDNPTLFPDCNHGMAMLGLLELVAATDVGTDDLFQVAKYANAYWFPQQMLEVAAFFRHRQETEFAGVDARSVVARDTFSASGFRRVHQWLADNGRLQQTPNGSDGCSL